MDLKNCSYDLDVKFVDNCDHCKRWQYQTHQIVRFGRYKLLITRIYEVENCFIGLAPGDLINTFSLLPGEEQELEIIRRYKYERALHEEMSIESEFQNELTNSIKIELGSSQDINFSTSAGGGFNFFGLASAEASVSTSTHLHFDQRLITEAVRKASWQVSRKYEMTIDTKTEVDNQYRSLRKIKNPNPCRVVTYFFKQMNKKYKVKITLVDIRFDILTDMPNFFSSKLDDIVKNDFFPVQEIYPVKTEQRPNEEELSEKLDINKKQNVFTSNFRKQPEIQKIISPNIVLSEAVRPVFKSLTREMLITKINQRVSSKTLIKELNQYIEKIITDKKDTPGTVITSYEYCIRTNNIIAEPKVSKCEICDCDGCDCHCKESDPALKDLEVEKMKVELEILKKKLIDE